MTTGNMRWNSPRRVAAHDEVGRNWRVIRTAPNALSEPSSTVSTSVAMTIVPVLTPAIAAPEPLVALRSARHPRIVPIETPSDIPPALPAPVPQQSRALHVAPAPTDSFQQAVMADASTMPMPVTTVRPLAGLFGVAAQPTVPLRTSPRMPGQWTADHNSEAKYWEWWGAARDGARTVLTPGQKNALVALGVLTVGLLMLWPRTFLTVCIAVMIGLYAVTGVYKFLLLLRGESATTYGSDGEAPIPDDELPIYTVLVPLHREGRILPVLVDRLNALDYPHDRLQIMLLVEMDDVQTIDAARACALPSHISLMVMPPGQPRTKPRALNVGLREALGKYIVIFDAEDRPERDQLRKAVAAFRKLPDDVVCVQGRLNFYNWRQSLLTRLFAVDYAAWYDQLLPGLAMSGNVRSGAFVPLGGTSNHFRVEVLRNVGGWDPFNVTEDCDLGARLGRSGLRVAMLDSTTWEEAVPNVQPWIRQRSRWIKGYLQTYLVHMRNPRLLYGQLGLRGFLDFQMLVGASCLVILINPIMWVLTVIYAFFGGTPIDAFIQGLFPPPLYYPALISLVIGNFVFFYSNAYVCVRHNHIALTRYALLAPFYWLLMSMGAWTGLISLIRNPFYWAKTEHGVSITQAERSLALTKVMYADQSIH